MTAKNASIPWTFVLDEPVRILIVDDDSLLCEFASVYLSSPCASIDIACGAAAGRLALSQNAYDILLLDIEMPDVDGFTLLAEIRASDEHLPVIMLTGHDDITSIDRAYQAGATSFATKPVKYRANASRLAACAGGRSSKQTVTATACDRNSRRTLSLHGAERSLLTIIDS